MPRRREACLFPPRRWRVLPCGLPVPVFRSGSRAAFPRRVPTEPERPPPRRRAARLGVGSDATSSEDEAFIEKRSDRLVEATASFALVFHSGDERYVLGRRGVLRAGRARSPRSTRRPARRTPRTPRTRRIRRVRRVRRVFHACRDARGDSSYGNTRRARARRRAHAWVTPPLKRTHRIDRRNHSRSPSRSESRSNESADGMAGARSRHLQLTASAAPPRRPGVPAPRRTTRTRAAPRAETPPRRRSAKIDPSALRRKARSVRAFRPRRSVDEKETRSRSISDFRSPRPTYARARVRRRRRRVDHEHAGGAAVRRRRHERARRAAVDESHDESVARRVLLRRVAAPAGGGGAAGIGTVPADARAQMVRRDKRRPALLAFRVVLPFFQSRWCCPPTFCGRGTEPVHAR